MREQIHGGDIYRHEGVVDFSSNMNPLGPPKGMMGAIGNCIYKIGNYPDVKCESLREEIERREGFYKEWVICGNGAAELIFSLVLGLKPRRALVQSPTFLEYELALEAVGCEIEVYETKEADQFRVGEEILEKIHEDLDLMFLCNPNNPTGTLLEPKLLKRICETCKEKEIYLVLDECFMEFVEMSERYSMKEEIKENSWIFLIKAFTKRYAMAGIRLGYGISSNQKILEAMENVTQPWNVSVIAQEAGVAALKEISYVKESMEVVSKEREYLKKNLKRLGLNVYDSKANYIFFYGSEDLYEKCLEKGFLIRDCSNYRGLEKGYYRIAVKMPKENQRLIKVLSELIR